jgi:hypothetical protein
MVTTEPETGRLEALLHQLQINSEIRQRLIEIEVTVQVWYDNKGLQHHSPTVIKLTNDETLLRVLQSLVVHLICYMRLRLTHPWSLPNLKQEDSKHYYTNYI